MSSGMIDINAKYLSELIDLSHCSYQCALYAEEQCSLRGHWPDDKTKAIVEILAKKEGLSHPDD
jgi:hypothetical protein